MPTLHAVTGPLLASGFRLAGLRVTEARTGAEAVAAAERLAGQADAGVILVEQALFDAIPEPRRHALERAPSPILVPVPAAEWAAGRGAAEAYIVELLQRAIGYRVRLQ